MRDPSHQLLESGFRIRPLHTARRTAVVLLSLLITGCLGLPNFLTRVDAPSLLLVDVRPVRGGDFEERLELDLLVQNPNNFEMVLDGMRLQLEMNGQRLAQAVTGQSVSIARLGETRVTVQASVTLLDATRSLLSLGGRERNGALAYRVAGEAFVAEPRSARVSFENSGEVLPGASAVAR
jgi:LEA14-like dessication related protein